VLDTLLELRHAVFADTLKDFILALLAEDLAFITTLGIAGFVVV
jgi:hypothetical protein